MGVGESHPHFVIVMPTTTPHPTMGSNKINDPTIAPDLAQHVHNRVWQCLEFTIGKLDMKSIE
jgi:hypothetical protein